jgi:hypothetical protein
MSGEHGLDYYLSRVERDENGCWLWTRGCSSTGYGLAAQPTPLKKWVLVHRAVYELVVGPIPSGLHIDHLCRVRRCVNPEHLEPVTPRENNLRSNSPSAIVVRTNRCKHGHELTPENVYLRPDGNGRQCRTCARRREVARTARRRAARAMNDAGHVATALVLAFCIAGSIAFLLALKYVGQPAMCKWSNQPKPSYCATAVQR